MRVLFSIMALYMLAACTSGHLTKKQDYDKEDGPRLAEFNYRLAAKFYVKNRADLAFRYLNTAVEHDPNNPVIRLAILDMYLANRDGDAALEYLDACPDTMKKAPEFLKRRALAYEINNMSEQAAALLEEAAMDQKPDLQSFIDAARNKMISDQCDKAMELLEKELHKHPNNLRLLEILSDLANVMKDYAREANFRMRLAKLSVNKNELLRDAAHAFALANNISQGIREISNLDRNAPGMSPGLQDACLGYLTYRSHRYEEAYAYFKNAFSSKSFQPATREILAFAEIRLRRNETAGAIDILFPCVIKNPKHGVARTALALAYLKNNQKDLAIKTVEEAPDQSDNQGFLEAIRNKLQREDHEN